MAPGAVRSREDFPALRPARLGDGGRGERQEDENGGDAAHP
jgi:hypothetical protein